MYPILDEQGEIDNIAVFSSDITVSKQMEEDLRESEEKYRNLVENVSDVIYAIDTNGVVSYVGPAIEALLGYSPEEIIGQHLSDFVPLEALGRASDGLQGALSGQFSTPNEYQVKTRSGDIRWIRVSSQPVLGSEGINSLQGVLTDITKLKQAEDQLRQ
jgi:PAS domain S-box-containing protein